MHNRILGDHSCFISVDFIPSHSFKAYGAFAIFDEVSIN